MAQPALITYNVGTGQPIHGGRYPGGKLAGAVGLNAAIAAGAFSSTPSDLAGNVTLDTVGPAGQLAPAPPATLVVVGDSLNNEGYNTSPAYWINGLAGGVLAPIAVASVPGNTVADVVARIDNAYTAGAPGLAGLPEPAGWALIMTGTNNARAGVIDDAARTAIDTLTTKALTYAQRVVFLAVPPLGGAEAANNARIPAYNAYFASKANGSTVFFIDGSTALKDGNGDQIAGFFNPDGIHFASSGTHTYGLVAGPQFAALLASYGYASPVDAAAASGSAQWHPNPLNAGTGGTLGSGYTGTLPNGYAISSLGAGGAAACSVVPAEPGDPNQTPWVVITPTALGAGGTGIRLALAAAGRTITGSDPGALDVVCEFKFVGFDAQRFTDVRTWMQCPGGTRMYGSGNNNEDLKLALGVGSALDQVVVLRTKLKRATANAESAPTIYTDLRSAGTYTGAMGSVQMRCHTIKG